MQSRSQTQIDIEKKDALPLIILANVSQRKNENRPIIPPDTDSNLCDYHSNTDLCECLDVPALLRTYTVIFYVMSIDLCMCILNYV